MSEKTVTVNGMVYDRQTGRPLRAERGHQEVKKQTAKSVHVAMQKSRTLNRKYVHRPTAAKKVAITSEVSKPPVIASRKSPTRPPTVTKHPSISRFAKPQAAKQSHKKTTVISDIGPTKHPLVQAAEQRLASKSTTVHQAIKPSQVLKNEAIAKATAAMPKKRAKPVKQSRASRAHRTLSMASAALALVLLGGYMTYLNMPALSTRVAATQAGINATYPAYQPSGYRLSGPVAYQEGNVSMKFAANAGPQSYTLSQTKSGWDSSAVLENYVTPKAGKDYSMQSVNGLTIYTYQANAAWVNGGILYTINGNAPLSSEQVERIATSL